MKFLDRDQVHSLCDYAALVDALQAMYARGCDAMERYLMSQPADDGAINDMLMQPAWMRGRAFGIKIANVFTGNEKLGKPSIHGMYLLFDGATGEPLAVIDGTAETVVKTASNSAVATRLLARPDAQTLLMMGAGNLAPHLIAAHCAVRPIRRVMIWNRTPAKAASLAARLDRPGLSVAAVGDPASAAGEADIVSCATYAAQPILKGEWLRPGAHVDLVGSYREDMRECDDEAIRRAGRLFVDARFSTVAVSGDVIAPLRSGALAEGRIADLFELASGAKPGRCSDDDITIFKSGGGGHEDLAVALALYERATGGG